MINNILGMMQNNLCSNEIMQSIMENCAYSYCFDCGSHCVANCIAFDENAQIAQFECIECYSIRIVENKEDIIGEICIDFDLLRQYLLTTKGKYNNIHALLNYFEASPQDYSIPQIYNNLKKNYQNRNNYILYNFIPQICLTK